MTPKPLFLRFFTLTLLLLWLVSCGGEENVTPTAVNDATPHPTATIPPVMSPTIPIPTVPPPPTTAAADPTTAVLHTPTTPLVIPDVVLSDKPVFATFKETAVSAIPAIFHDPIAPDLGNVYVPFALAPDQLARLSQDGIFVSPGVEKEFFTVYEQARYANVPIFVTSDSLLHVYHLLFDKVLRTAETQQFIPLLQALNTAVLAQTDAQYQTLIGTPWEEAARRSVAFIAVGSKLLDPNTAVPAYAADLVNAELALISDANGIAPSPLFPGLEHGEDYTQYIPRGHYTRSEALQAYFRSMMWYGRMTFRLTTRDPEVGRAESRAALLLVHALRTAQVGQQSALDAWLDLYNPTVFFVGRSDDLTAMQYLDVIDAVYGPNANLEAIANDTQLDTFIAAAAQLPPPRILGLVISIDDDETETTKGFRFMGQRFVPDAYIFRQLIFRNVGADATGVPRMLPNGLDVMSALGSDRAYTLLNEMGQTSYVGYPEQMDKVRTWTAGLSVTDWTETLYTTWLYTFYPLLAVPSEGYPQFMQSNAWLDKQLNTSLGSWAELKHDTILYAKQVYAELGGGGGPLPPSPILASGYVEPVPEFYARISALTGMTLDGLLERGLLSDQDMNSLMRIRQLADAFQVMAEKELRGEPLTEDEYYLIRYYGGELEHLVMASADVPEEDPFAAPYMDEEPQAAIIADVATAPDPDGDGIPNPVVLEVGVGRVNELYAVVPLIRPDGSIFLQVAKGATFSYYEFPWPADDRLTDEKWQTMLDAGNAPALPAWTAGFFTPETAYTAFQTTIYRFQEAIPWIYWDLQSDGGLPEAVTAVFQPQLDALRTAKQYIGRQWIQATYRSFDIQSEDLAVVTVRETWQDTLYQALYEYPDYGDTVLGVRGPYTLDVTYTLQRTVSDGFVSWQVINVVFANEAPAWNAPQ